MSIRSEIRAALVDGPKTTDELLPLVPSAENDRARLSASMSVLATSQMIRRTGLADDGKPIYQLDPRAWPARDTDDPPPPQPGKRRPANGGEKGLAAESAAAGCRPRTHGRQETGRQNACTATDRCASFGPCSSRRMVPQTPHTCHADHARDRGALGVGRSAAPRGHAAGWQRDRVHPWIRRASAHRCRHRPPNPRHGHATAAGRVNTRPVNVCKGTP
jgi:hypothetical protein